MASGQTREEEFRDAIADPQPLLSPARISALEAAERRYRQIAAAGGWPHLPPLGSTESRNDARVNSLLAQRLALEGDLAASPTGHLRVDSLHEGLRRFQTRHGLRATGLMNAETIDALNHSAEYRLTQIRTNLARAKDFRQSVATAQRYVVVNIPAFRLEAVNSNSVAGRHRVIVGRVDRQTPSLKATIQRVNFLPYWHVPDSVARLDLIPRLAKDPAYLAREHIRVLRDWQKEEISAESIDWSTPAANDFKFKQDPGPWNALGLVRLDMPNEHNVYLHDTPMKELFSRPDRTFSAGCVRVEGVFDLTAWLLKDIPGWTSAKVGETATAGNPIDVTLPRPVAVFFVYVNAWADQEGAVHFRRDVYGRDGHREEATLSSRNMASPTLSP